MQRGRRRLGDPSPTGFGQGAQWPHGQEDVCPIRLCAGRERANVPLAVDLPALTRWLADAFDSVELRYVVRMGPEGEAMAGFLPETCSPAHLCLSVAEGWRRRGLFGATLRNHLVAFRPSRSEEVNALIKKSGFALVSSLPCHSVPVTHHRDTT